MVKIDFPPIPSRGLITIFSVFDFSKISSICSSEFVTTVNGMIAGKFNIINFSLFSLNAFAGLIQSTPEISNICVKYKYSLLKGGFSLLITKSRLFTSIDVVLLTMKLSSLGLGKSISLQSAYKAVFL